MIRLTKALRDLAPRARCGDDLIALGEAWSAIQQILDGCAIDVNVGLSVSRDFEEGLFMCFRINDEVIILDELNTTGGVLRTLAVLCTQQRWLDGKLVRFRALEDAVGIDRCTPIIIGEVNSVGQQAPALYDRFMAMAWRLGGRSDSYRRAPGDARATAPS